MNTIFEAPLAEKLQRRISLNARSDSGRCLRLYRSVRSFIPAICTFWGLLAVVLGVAYVLLLSANGEVYGWRAALIRVLALVPAVYLLNLIRIYFNELYVFKPHVMCHHHGRLSLRYEMPVIYYSDVREIIVKQGLLGRLLDYGDLFVGTAATKNVQVHLKGIARPHSLEKFLENMRRNQMKATKKEEEAFAQAESSTEEPKTADEKAEAA